MNFTTNRNKLIDELSFVKGALESKTSIESLNYLLVEALAGKIVRITGTDLDITARGEVEAEKVGSKGAACLPARKLFDVVRSLEGETVTFNAVENDRVTVGDGHATFRLAGVGAGKFPEVRELAKAPLSLAAATFRFFTEQVSYAISREGSRYALEGAQLQLSKDGARMVATDQHRLALAESLTPVAGANGTAFEFLVPTKALKLATSLTADAEGDVRIGADDNLIRFEYGSRVLNCRRLVGTFPDYHMVIPRNTKARVEVYAPELQAAVRRAALISDERARGVCLTLTPGTVTVTCERADVGDSKEIVKADYEGAEMTVGFNAYYLIDILNAAGDVRVSVEFADRDAQFAFRPVGVEGPTKIDVLMPMRI